MPCSVSMCEYMNLLEIVVHQSHVTRLLTFGWTFPYLGIKGKQRSGHARLVVDVITELFVVWVR